jgi:hypothetical protein
MSRIKKLIHMGYTSRNRIEMVRGGSRFFSRLLQLIETPITPSICSFIYFLMMIQAIGLFVPCRLLLHGECYRLSSTGCIRLPGTISKIGGCPEGSRSTGKWFEPLFKSRHFYFRKKIASQSGGGGWIP